MNYKIDAFSDRILSLNLDSEDTVENLAEILILNAELWHKNLRSISMEGQRGAANWYEFETKLWQFGESIRQILLKKKTWRNSKKLLDSIAKIIETSKYGKGRQPFLELIAKYGESNYNTILINAVDDSEIVGHAIKSLRIAKIPGEEDKISAVLETKIPAWIKREAKKYLHMYSINSKKSI